jgi:parallel beta-helix repeat protein
MPNIKAKFKKIFIIIILLFFLIGTIPLNFTPNYSRANSNPPQNMNNGWWNTTKGNDWIIDSIGNLWLNKNITVSDSLHLISGGNLTLQNCTIIIENSLHVGYNSSLKIINTTIKFNSSANGSSEFRVYSGGSALITDYDNDNSTIEDRSNITSNITDNNHRFLFVVDKVANFTFQNSELHQCGYSILSPDLFGLYIQTNNSIIRNNLFSENCAGLVLESSNNTILNNEFRNNEKYGCLIAFSRKNWLHNNSFVNNGYNFGLLLANPDQETNITLANKINGRSIYYIENSSNYNLISTNSAGFLGIIGSKNVNIANQDLYNNFEGIILLYTNDTIISNSNFTSNNFGAIIDNSNNITFINCRIANNTDLGLNIRNSNIRIINSSVSTSKIFDIEVNYDSFIEVINSSINISRIQVMDKDSRIEYKYYLEIYTKNHQNNIIGNVTLDIYDGKNNFVGNFTTDENGISSGIPLTNYVILKSGFNNSMSNHRLYTKFSGIEFNQYVNMNRSRSVIMYLNHPPEIIENLSSTIYLDEEVEFYHDFNFTDRDADIVTWHIESDANWLNTIGKTSGIINGTPTDPDIGTFYMNVSCNDSYNGFDFFNFTIIVNNTNDPPQITSKQGVGEAFEDIFYHHNFNVLDPDIGDSHTWSMVTNAKWLNPINKYLGTIYGIPRQNNIGSFFVNVTCKDSEEASESYNFTLIVNPTNDAPMIVNPENSTELVNEDSKYYHDFNYIDVDPDSVTWQVTTNASWLEAIDTLTGVLTGTPGDYDVGRFYVNVSCTDSNDSSTYQNYTIVVRNTNDHPIFVDKGGQIFYTNEDEIFEQDFKIFDPDAVDTYEFSLAIEELIIKSSGVIREPTSSEPTLEWLELIMNKDPRSCTIFGVPKNDEVGEILINLTCMDQLGLSTSITFSIIVNNTNDAPIITSDSREQNITYILEDMEYSHDFDFIDVDGDSVTWDMNTNAKWLSNIDKNTGVISGLPTQINLGMYYVEVVCRDPYGGFDSQNFTLQVNNTNDPPMISNLCPKIVYILENEFYQYDFNSIDFDSNRIYWFSQTNAPWLNKIDRFTGIINGTPSDYDVGEYFVNITCIDNHFDSANWNFTIIVNNTNDAPQITNGHLAPSVVYLRQDYYFKFEYSDVDGDIVTWKVKMDAGIWMQFDAATAELSGTPNRLNVGVYNINISCSDPSGDFSYYKYVLRVKGINNRPPELSNGYITPKNGDVDTVFTFYVTYRDMDYHEPSIVGVMIGDSPLILEHFDGDDKILGMVYYGTIELSKGSYAYYFYAKDEMNAHAIIEDNITGSKEKPSIIVVSEKSSKQGFDLSQDESILSIVVLIIFLIIILIGLASIIRYRRRISKHHDRVVEDESVSTEKPEITLTDDSLPEPLMESVVQNIEKFNTDEEPRSLEDLMICPQCGEIVDESFDSCPGCGVEFSFDKVTTDEDIEDLPADEAPPEIDTEPDDVDLLVEETDETDEDDEVNEHADQTEKHKIDENEKIDESDEFDENDSEEIDETEHETEVETKTKSNNK